MPIIYTYIFAGSWYLSSHGKDTPQCGTSYKTACATLDYLLVRSYSKTQTASLTIITDTNMTFNNRIKVCSMKVIQSLIPMVRKMLSQLNPTSGFGPFYMILSGSPTSFCLVYLRSTFLLSISIISLV